MNTVYTPTPWGGIYRWQWVGGKLVRQGGGGQDSQAEQAEPAEELSHAASVDDRQQRMMNMTRRLNRS